MDFQVDLHLFNYPSISLFFHERKENSKFNFAILILKITGDFVFNLAFGTIIIAVVNKKNKKNKKMTAMIQIRNAQKSRIQI